jgi:predicted AAA+ superfamily ATPase
MLDFNKRDKDCAVRYYPRAIAETIKRVGSTFPALIITGPRQVGKTTVLSKALEAKYLTFDDPLLRESALLNPLGFLDANQPPVILDEIQYATNLLVYLKMRIDSDGGRGLYYLTGSQQFELMKGVTESLAGRIAVLPMLGLSARELRGLEFFDPFLPSKDFISRSLSYERSDEGVWSLIYRGSMPRIWADETIDRDIFYSSYTRTYIERDVRSLTQIGDELTFLNFMRVIAANTAQLLNLDTISKEVGVSAPTVKRWLSVLITSGLVFLLQPYHSNQIKTITKTPKLYFLETGLAAYLTRWPNAETLEAGAASGAFFETFVVSEIIKSYYNVGKEPPIFFYRDSHKNEIDLVFEVGDVLYPVEIKKTTNPHYADTQVFTKLDAIAGRLRGTGALICQAPDVVPVGNDSTVLPVGLL